MAPPKTRATTLQEKFGFVDEELKTPQHDAMLIWIDQQAEELVQEYFSIPATWSEDAIARVRSEADKIVRNRVRLTQQWAGLGEPPPRKLVIKKKIWESPIVTEKGFAVGFADMEVLVQLQESLSCEYAVNFNQEDGLPEWCCKTSAESVVFEAKTSIRSVGELIRQIRLYQEYRKGHYIVVSPDDRFADVLRGQGIQFVKYEDPQSEK